MPGPIANTRERERMRCLEGISVEREIGRWEQVGREKAEREGEKEEE